MAHPRREKRKHERIERPVTARFRVYTEGDSKTAHNWDMVTITNLSQGGMFFDYVDKFALGTILEFNIALPSTREWVHCLARVCRVDRKSPPGSRRIPVYGVAVNFTEIEEGKEESLQTLIKVFS